MALPVISRDAVNERHHHELDLADPETLEMFEKFGCNVRVEGSPPTPDRVEPHVALVRDVFTSLDIRMPDGREVRMWGFEDGDKVVLRPYPLPPLIEDPRRSFPSAAIRVREGQIVHTTGKMSHNSNTIHHHGIEPTAVNDGVGHTSFEVTGSYDYQWRAAYAGTYLYHCHKNTTLHFEMGMYGLLIVDPPEGPGFARRAMEVVPYDVEAWWVPDEIDPRWHDIHHSAGLDCPFDDEDPGLNYMDPEYFLISGVPHPWSRNSPLAGENPGVAAELAAGQTLLARVANASYAVLRITLHGLDSEVIAVDGRTLGGPGDGRYSRPFLLPSGVPFELTTAQRWDLLVRPTAPGTFPVSMEFLHWISGDVIGVAETEIVVQGV
jgi:FtsP/CotA-like multicopper oxidase with cupredoxin domain